MRMLQLPQGSLKVLGEHPALDLLNSVDDFRGRHFDALHSVDAMVRWAELLDLLSPAQAQDLRGDPEAERVRLHAIDLRELLCSELREPGAKSSDLTALLNRFLPNPLVVAERRGVALPLHDSSPADRLLAPLALYAADLLLCIPRDKIRACRSPGCEWFFLDQSRGRRQWCIMSGCGNAAKARRHRARARTAA